MFFLGIASAISQPTSADLSGDATICSGETANLVVTIVGGNGTYRVELSDGTIADPYTSGSNIPVSPSSTTSYTLISVEDTDGAAPTLTGNPTITVNTPPTATASDNGTCIGATLDLTGGPDGMSSYAWTGPNAFSSSSQSPNVAASATAAMAGTYTLTVTNAAGCT
ncbi:MAG: hypothetical protein MI975_19355, partial [Cytophagales bacterium]|nr:hypothetical protein [Cytophagales bacterium]